MKNFDEIIAGARKTLKIEAESVAKLGDFIGEEYARIVETIIACKGRLVITGIGKSANIANKIVATLNSTGTPAIFMHAADAIHGDLGNVQKDDVVICISKSGNTPEIKSLVPLLKNMGNTIIALVGNLDSFLSKHAHFTLNASVEKEACPNNLAPTSSTTAQLALGDALAVSLMEYRGFTGSDFAKYHPGGALGKKLYLRLEDMLGPETKPSVVKDVSIKEVIMAISAGRVGAVVVLENEAVVGMITDGDLRRMLEKHTPIDLLNAADIMNSTPKVLDADTLAVRAFAMMEEHNILQVAVTRDSQYLGIVHPHDILKEGIF